MKNQKKTKRGRSPMPKGQAYLSLRVLGYLDDGEWAAHCLETDLVGRGKSFAEALKDLDRLTEMQVSFAMSTKQPSLLDHPAPPDIWQTYERLAAAHLRSLDRKWTSETTTLGTLPLREKVDSRGRLAWSGA